MEDPAFQIRTVVKQLVEPVGYGDMCQAVDRYFHPKATIVHPMLNSPQQLGREGVKAAYRMLRVLTYDNKMEFRTVGVDRADTTTVTDPNGHEKGVETQVLLLDMIEHLKIRVFPVPEWMNPTIHLRFLTRVELQRENGGLWLITKQEDNLPTDLAATGLPTFGLKYVSDAIKMIAGGGTFLASAIVQRSGFYA
ncbi:hypothetical protein MNV49_002955 [Pseudohyphozyma bogoriensis]|nr:hypothetical protein MNV49_002955 [Pseudohyphozyma bogoriensis]